MIEVVFTIIVVSEAILAGLLFATIAVDGFRAWPPPDRKSWQFWTMWGLFTIAMTGVLLLGIMDWNSSFISHWVRYLVGGVLVIVGAGYGTSGIMNLGIRATSGEKGTLEITGPYRYSRNPQYVGDIVLFVGYSLLCNSTFLFIAVAIGIVCFALAPFTEESWLIEKYGNCYVEYASRVPRFLSVRHMVKMVLSRESDTYTSTGADNRK